MPADEVRDFARVLVQTARTMPSSDAGWTSQPLIRFTGGSEGAGLVLGEAALEQDYGELQLPGSGQFVRVGVSPNVGVGGSVTALTGQLVRLLKQTTGGTVTFQGVSYSPFWWGIIHDHGRLYQGANQGRAAWTAVGIASLLDQIVLRDGWVSSFTGGDPARPGYLPPFNALPGGDRTSATFSVGWTTAYIHDLSSAASGNRWTAKQILDLLLAGATYAPGGTQWTVTDADNCLSYQPEELDLDGQTLLAAVNILVAAKRGLTWHVTVSGSTATIVVRSTVSSAITVGSYTLPASSAQVSLDATSDPAIEAPSIVTDESMTYDVIELRGEHPWVALTIEYDGTEDAVLLGSGDGWDEALEPAWEEDQEASLVEHVWRRFLVREDWNGHQYNDEASGLRDNATTATDSAYGSDGYTGAREFTGGSEGPIPPAWMLKLERMLPCSAGFGTDRLAPRQPPVVVLYDGSEYVDVSSARQVQVEDRPLAVVIDDGDYGRLNQADLEDVAGAKLLVTLAVREVMPLRVSWERALSDRPRPTPRVKVIHVPGIEQWVVLDGTVTGVSDAGVLETQSGDLTVRDDTATLRGLLALARAYYGKSAVTAQWTNRGELDVATTYKPTALLTGITMGSTSTLVGAVITRRSWRLVIDGDVERWDTTYDTERIMAEVEAIL